MVIDKIVTGPFQVNTYFVPVERGAMTYLIIVDPGGNEELIFSYINTLGIIPAYIVLTHGHFDHLGAIPALIKKYPNIKIAINKNDSFYLGEQGYKAHYSDFSALGASSLVQELKQRYPVLPEVDCFLEDTIEPDFMPGWMVMSTPGHSAGSVCLYNAKEGILLSGDTMFAHSCGRTDLHGGNMQQMQTSLQKLLKLPKAVKVYPGHGLTTTIAAEYNTYGW